MMRFDAIRKSIAVTLGSAVLVGFLFAAGCSESPTPRNKLDDPNLKAYMEKTTEQFKTKMQEMKTNKKGSSKGVRPR